MTRLFIEQPLALPGSAKYISEGTTVFSVNKIYEEKKIMYTHLDSERFDKKYYKVLGISFIFIESL